MSSPKASDHVLRRPVKIPTCQCLACSSPLRVQDDGKWLCQHCDASVQRDFAIQPRCSVCLPVVKRPPVVHIASTRGDILRVTRRSRSSSVVEYIARHADGREVPWLDVCAGVEQSRVRLWHVTRKVDLALTPPLRVCVPCDILMGADDSEQDCKACGDRALPLALRYFGVPFSL